jgi:hypothetical protein
MAVAKGSHRERWLNRKEQGKVSRSNFQSKWICIGHKMSGKGAENIALKPQELPGSTGYIVRFIYFVLIYKDFSIVI